MIKSKIHLKIASDLQHCAQLMYQIGFEYDAHTVYGIASRVEEGPDKNKEPEETEKNEE